VGTLTVYYDDGCAMCVGAIRAARRRDPARRIRPRGLSGVGGPFQRADMMRELHVVDEAGNVSRGYDAVVTVIAALSHRGSLARLLRARAVRPLGRWAYRFVARHRRTASSG
jgi:predicted DCC family thiol-disulfide oxidoreductase YuxK